jgi:hypothetical protein
VANVSHPVRIERWISVTATRTVAEVSAGERTLRLIAEGRTGRDIGGCKIFDILAVKGVRVGGDLLVEEAEVTWLSILEPGWEPVLLGYRRPGDEGMRRAA